MVLMSLNRLPIRGGPLELKPRIDARSQAFGNPFRHVPVSRFFVEFVDRCFVGRVLQQFVALLKAHLSDEGQLAEIFFIR